MTKADAADPDTLELVLEEARELVPGAAVVPVSAKTGEGLDELRARRWPRPRKTRALTVLGATGSTSIASSRCTESARSSPDAVVRSVGEGDELRAEPRRRGGSRASVQVHDEPVERADAGQRVALALPGIERTSSGVATHLVEPGSYPVSYRVDVQLEEPRADR